MAYVISKLNKVDFFFSILFPVNVWKLETASEEEFPVSHCADRLKAPGSRPNTVVDGLRLPSLHGP